MRRRKWLWIGFGMLCLLAVAIGYLARPEDEYDFLRPFHPSEEYDEVRNVWDLRSPPRYWIHKFHFPQESLKGAEDLVDVYSVHFIYNDWEMIDFPNGQRGAYNRLSHTLSFQELQRPSWLSRAWLTIKHRLGLD